MISGGGAMSSSEIGRRAMIRTVAGLTGVGYSLKAAPETKPTSAKTTSGAVTASYSKAIVETASGKVRGFINRGVWVFRGIPYGAPTGGANRFMPAVKPQPWTGVRSCLTYGPSCPNTSNISENGDNAPR